MPTLAGLRRRGYTPEAIRDFCERIGVAKADSMVDIALLEHCIREDLNRRAARVMAVLRPAAARDRELPRGPGRGAGRGQQPGGSRDGHAQAFRSRASSCIEQRRLPRGPADEVLPAGAGRRGAPALRLLRPLHGRGQGPAPPARSSRCAARYDPATPRRRRARWSSGQGHHPLGLGARTPSPPRCACTRASSPSANPSDEADGLDWKAHLNPASLEPHHRRPGRARA